MPTYSDFGIILKSFDFSEADKIFTIYTKTSGLVRAICKGIKKNKSKFSGKIDQLYCLFLQFANGRNLDIICEVEQVNCFAKLRESSTRIFYGFLLLDIVNSFALEGESESSKVYSLLYSSLDKLQDIKYPELIAIKFTKEFLQIHGFKPQFETCVSCSKELRTQHLEDACKPFNKHYPYSSTLGGLLCKNCADEINHKTVNTGVLNILESNFEENQDPKDMDRDFNKDIRQTLGLLKDHLNTRAKGEIKTFDLVFSL